MRGSAWFQTMLPDFVEEKIIFISQFIAMVANGEF